MKKIIIFLVLSNVYLGAITDIEYYLFTGAWDTRPLTNQETNQNYIPGRGKFIPNGSIEIFLSEEASYIWNFDTYEIDNIKQVNRQNFHFSITIDSTNWKGIAHYRIFNFGELIAVSDPTLTFRENQTYYKIAGPIPPGTGPYYTPTNINLRLREQPILSSNIIEQMNPGRMVVILQNGELDTISSETGRWVKIETVNGVTGWCFDAFLEEIIFDFQSFNGFISNNHGLNENK